MINQKTSGPHNTKKPTSIATNFIAGGAAGMTEALVCHPLDTIKVRMQLSRRSYAPGTKKHGFIATGTAIVKRETVLGLYKGLGAVMTGIVPKMAIRFTSFEAYKRWLSDKNATTASNQAVFMAGLAAGVTEAVAVVTPMEVLKIRLQAQNHSMADPLDVPKYRNAAHALYTVLKEEGPSALYRGVSLTALRQGSNQAVNFTAYSYLKDLLQAHQSTLKTSSGDFSAVKSNNLPAYQTTLIGLVSGALGPFSNAPIDTIKTRLQKTPANQGDRALARIVLIAQEMWQREGMRSFYKGITPRVMRVAPGQAVTFTVYEALKELLEGKNSAIEAGKYEE
ncbi:Succinate/fumarate mitochondrial transporter [Golovinomyces cichoracearum]|uniref:Succinate/fumarate mitochondrial transporter n=1 Tax=Golovinomyces cichoracearum TaxID=62708 RepID=A0A420GHG7_9PEZI|nr:Succinate/fumarate mitochondrial transporter [Golovinomyces cichoracearum]